MDKLDICNLEGISARRTCNEGLSVTMYPVFKSGGNNLAGFCTPILCCEDLV